MSLDWERVEELRAELRAELIKSGKDPDRILFQAKSARRHAAGQVDGMLYKAGGPSGDEVADVASGAKPATHLDRIAAQVQMRRRHQKH